MKVFLEEHEELQMKEIESWLQHGPASVPTITEREILKQDEFSGKVTAAILTGVAVVVILAVYGLMAILAH